MRVLVCCNSGGKAPNAPPKLLTSKATVVGGGLCEGASGDVNSMVQAMKTMTSWESTEQSKWERPPAAVDSGAAEKVLLAGICSHVNLTATRRSRGAGGERIRNHGQRKFLDGHVAGRKMAGGGRDETAHVCGQDGRSRESCASRQQGSQGSQTEGSCHSFAES